VSRSKRKQLYKQRVRNRQKKAEKARHAALALNRVLGNESQAYMAFITRVVARKAKQANKSEKHWQLKEILDASSFR